MASPAQVVNDLEQLSRLLSGRCDTCARAARAGAASLRNLIEGKESGNDSITADTIARLDALAGELDAASDFAARRVKVSLARGAGTIRALRKEACDGTA